MSAHPASWFRAADGRLDVRLQILIVVLVGFVAVSLASLPLFWLEEPAVEITHAVALFILAIGSFVWLTRRLDRRSTSPYGLRNDRKVRQSFSPLQFRTASGVMTAAMPTPKNNASRWRCSTSSPRPTIRNRSPPSTARASMG